MKRIMKAVAVAALALLVGVSAFAAGGKDAKAAQSGPVTVKYWMGLSADKLAPVYSNMADSEVYKELMKRTGVNVQFLHPPVGQDRDQFNLIVASMDLPDIMEFDLRGAYPGGPAKAITDGVTVKHNDIIAKYAPNLTALYKANPEWAKLAKTDDGFLYGFPFVRGDPSLMVFYGAQFRKDYLDELGLKTPVTIDDWYATLKAMKEKKGLQFPFSFRQKATGQDGNDLFLAGTLSGAWGVTRGFQMDGKQIKYGPIEPGWKDFIMTMAKWYKEGLIDPDFPVQDLKTWRAKVMDGQTGAFLGYTGGGLGYFYDNVKASNPKFTLVGAPNPVLKAGTKSRFGQKDWDVPNPSNSFITSKAKDVAAAAKLLDYGYGKEGDILLNFGVEGKSFTWVNNYPKYTDWITKNPDGKPMALTMSTYMRSHYAGPMVQRKEYFEQFMKYPDQLTAVNNWAGSSDFSWRVPPTTPSTEESAKLAAIMNEVNVYVDEMLVKFIMGQASLDQWDAYIAQVKKLKIDEAIAIQMAALDRFNKR